MLFDSAIQHAACRFLQGYSVDRSWLFCMGC